MNWAKNNEKQTYATADWWLVQSTGKARHLTMIGLEDGASFFSQSLSFVK